ncbi:uncharacterized protein LOC128042497 [Gossypium raimondii]|uniref:uncharacterized protein LOC128042497 n=1 Tax=Gossypium raimondii TaxID=29730 RepID=UPI00227C7045|nr:uncharacterized protein LOC128042497 [Gossypium raimondii]
MSGEMIESAIKSGKIDVGENNRRQASKKKESEVNNMNTYNKSITVNQPRKVVANQQGSQSRNLVRGQPPYPKWYDANAQCDYHAGITGHSIEHCTAFRMLVEKLISMGVVKVDDASGTGNPLPNHTDTGVNMMSENMGEGSRRALLREVGFFEEVEEKGSICASESMTRILKVNHPVIIISRPKVNEARAQVTSKIVIQKPTNFSYKDSKKVPWNYECIITISGKDSLVSIVKETQKTGSYTRSEKNCDLINAQAESVEGKIFTAEKKKERTVEPRPLINEPIKEEEATEFLKFLKHSEYSVVEQLHKQPVRISMLALLMSSEVHRNALMKVLNKTYVANDISVKKLDRLVSNISADNFIFFNDDKIPSRGMGSTKALHITTRCKGYILPGVLIDNGSSLNVLPLSTLNRLLVDSSYMKTCQNVVRAFDGTERKVMGRIEIPLLIDPNTYEVDFIVMNIKPSYNCLLGRHWIHSAGAVPSSLHQKLKLVSEGWLVTINAEESIIASITSNAPYVETDDEVVECSFRSLEFVNATFIAEGNRIPMPKISKTTKMGLQLIVGRGLGRHLQGRVEAPMMKDKFDRFGLGYRLDIKQRRKEIEKRRERRRARLSGEEVKWEPMVFPHISKTFVLGGSFILNEEYLKRKMYVVATEENPQMDHVWKLNFDGASNAMGNGIGAVLVSPSRDHYPIASKLDFDCTNNMAEYEACSIGIRPAIERKIKMLKVYGDSALVIYQLKGEWETRDPKLISYRKMVLELMEEFDDISLLPPTR